MVFSRTLLHLLGILDRNNVEITLRRGLGAVVSIGAELGHLRLDQILEILLLLREILVLLWKLRGNVFHLVVGRTCKVPSSRHWVLEIHLRWDNDRGWLLFLDAVVHFCGLNILLILPLRVWLRFVSNIIDWFWNRRNCVRDFEIWVHLLSYWCIINDFKVSYSFNRRWVHCICVEYSMTFNIISLRTMICSLTVIIKPECHKILWGSRVRLWLPLRIGCFNCLGWGWGYLDL